MKQEMTGWQWHQLDNMQVMYTSLQTHNHASVTSHTGWMLFLTPNEQCHKHWRQLSTTRSCKDNV